MRVTSTRNIVAIATLLGASLLISAPSSAQTRGEKWWQPKQGRQAQPRQTQPRHRVEGRAQVRHGGSPRGFDRQYRQWRGQRIYRDAITIRSGGGYRGPRYRAYRTYWEPQYIYRRRIVRLRPIRYYVAASAIIGGVHIGARYHDHDDYYYGCNFCDARFDAYGSYRAHVYDCDARPHGYTIETHDWNDRELQDGEWWDDRNWEQDHSYKGDQDYDHSYKDDQDYDDEYRD